MRIWRDLREWCVRRPLELFWAAVLVIALAAGIQGSLLVDTPYAGALFGPAGEVGGGVDSDVASLFVYGDFLVELDGHAVSSMTERLGRYAAAGIGHTVDHTLIRRGTRLHVRATVRPFTWGALGRFGGASIGFGCGFAILGLLLMARARRLPEARTFSAWCAVMFLASVTNVFFSLVPWTLPFFALAANLVGGLMITLAIQLGPQRRFLVWPILASVGMWVAGLAILPYGNADFWPAGYAQSADVLWVASITLIPLLIGGLVFPALIGLNMRRAERFSLAFQQNRVIFWSSVLAFLPVFATWTALLLQLGMPPWVARLSLLSFLVLPMGIVFAVTRYRLFAIEQLIRRTLTYSVLAGILASTYVAGVGLFLRLFGNGHGEAFRLTMFMGMALVFDPLHRRVKTRLDRGFDRGRMSLLDVQRRISQRATEHRDTEQTLDGIARDLKDALRLTRCALALPHDEQLWMVSGETELLGNTMPLTVLPSVTQWDRESHAAFPWPDGIDAAFAIVQRDRLLAVIFLGERKSQEALSPQDYDYLGLVSGQIGLLLSYTQVLDRQANVDREMQKLLAQVAEINELRASFGIVASHELRTPLTVIRGHAEALLSGVFGDLDPEQVESVRSIFQSASSMSLQITSYLDLMALRENKLTLRPTLCDVATIVFEALEGWTDDLEAHEISLRVDVEGADKVHADPRRLRQVLDQLLSNAIKFTPREGSILISAQSERSHVVLQVRDTGPGIPPDALSRAFDDFAQVADPTQRDHGGLGLGLPLAKALLEAMKGWISYAPALNGGSVFSCGLPLPPQVIYAGRRATDFFNTVPRPSRVKSVQDPDTGLWKVMPDEPVGPAPSPGVTMDQVVFENPGDYPLTP